MVFFNLSTCLRDATLHDNSPTLQYRHLCNAADTWLWRPFIVSVLRRVNFPFMINTPLKEGQGKNTPIRRLDIPDLCLLLLRWTEAGEGGSIVTNPYVMRTLTSDVPWSLTVSETPVMQTLNSAALMSVLSRLTRSVDRTLMNPTSSLPCSRFRLVTQCSSPTNWEALRDERKTTACVL